MDSVRLPSWPSQTTISDAPAATAPEAEPLPLPSRETRQALWDNAGLVRTPEGLRSLLDDPHPLARLVAQCALHREETRGSHVRTDFPDLRPDLDEHHAVVRDDTPAFEIWK